MGSDPITKSSLTSLFSRRVTTLLPHHRVAVGTLHAMPISDQARELLEQPIFASLATIGPDGHPQVTVIWLHIEGEKVFFNTAAGRAKYRNMIADPRVTVLLLDPENGYRYAELRGTAEVTETGGDQGIDDLAMKYLGTPYPFRREGETRVQVWMDVNSEHWQG